MHDIFHAIQGLRKHPGFTTLALITLALGIGATTVAFAVFDTVLLRPLPYAHAANLIYMQEETEKHTVRPPSHPNFVDWRAQARSFDGVVSAMCPYSETVTAESTPLRAVVMGVSQRFFSVLGVTPFLGREFTAAENRVGGSPAVMVSYEFWISEMGGRQLLGSIDMDGELTPVVGILPPGFRFVQDADLFVPHERGPGENPTGKIVRTNYLSAEWQTVVGVVSEASSWTMERGSQPEIFVPMLQHVKDVQSQLIAVVRTAGDSHRAIASLSVRLHGVEPGMPAKLATFDDRIAQSAFDRNFAMVALLIFGGIALVLAGIGIYGVMSYSVTTREHEIGIRMALGATPGGLLMHVIGNAATMAIGGIAFGIAAGSFVTQSLQSILYGVTPSDPLSRIVGAAALFLTALIGAYIPARRSSRIDPLIAMRSE